MKHMVGSGGGGGGGGEIINTDSLKHMGFKNQRATGP